jgi:16S rRNA (guanine966-N2)-methyltransferase
MRVISGEAKGRRLKTPSSIRIRPTADRVKEALFGIIGDRIYDHRVLDLFAGTGNLGIEALSRGARWVLFVDRAKEAIDIIQENLRRTGLTDRAGIWRTGVFAALSRLRKEKRCFEVVFLDPPYGYQHIERVLRTLQQARICVGESLVVVEHDKRDILPRQIDSLRIGDERRFGDTVVTFFTQKVER